MLTHDDWLLGTEVRLDLHSHRLVTQFERVCIVREADTSLAPNAPRTRCLICENALTVRRTWNYPRDWARLSDTELLELFA